MLSSINLKKISFIIVAMTTNLIATESDGFSTDKFNPENSTFSQMRTLETWVASHHQTDHEKMKNIQRNVAMEVPENLFSRNFFRHVTNNPGDNRHFGKTFPALKSVQLPFLQFVHEASQVKSPIVLEIACSYGLVTWKIPYCFEKNGIVYANELSSVMLNTDFDTLIEHRCQENGLHHLFQKLPGSCFNIIVEHPELIGQVDAIFAQNLEHFFNPVQHQEFLTLLSTLLTKSGRAFLASHTIKPESVIKGNPVFDLYVKNKETMMYPGFMKCKGVCKSLASGALIGDVNITEAVYPDSSTECGTETINKLSRGFVDTGIGEKEVFKITQEVVSNFYTPTIYKKSIAPHPSLKMVNSFFMDQSGNGFEKFSDGKASHAVAIIEKI